MSKTDKTDPYKVKILKALKAGDLSQIRVYHDHKRGPCDLAEFNPMAPRPTWRTRYRYKQNCDARLTGYLPVYERPRYAKGEASKRHRAARRAAKVSLVKGKTPEPLRTRHGVIWDME